jgi:hypothetical protein
MMLRMDVRGRDFSTAALDGNDFEGFDPGIGYAF